MQSVAEATASAGLILVLFNASDSAVEPTKKRNNNNNNNNGFAVEFRINGRLFCSDY